MKLPMEKYIPTIKVKSFTLTTTALGIRYLDDSMTFSDYCFLGVYITNNAYIAEIYRAGANDLPYIRVTNTNGVLVTDEEVSGCFYYIER